MSKMLPLSPEQQQWFAATIISERVNPCVRLYGPGPEGAKCETCVQLLRKRLSKTYLKCDFRENTNGAATDHKAGWAACARYEEATQ